MTNIDFKVAGIERAIEVLRVPSRGRAEQWAIQSINRAGRSVRSQADREFRASVLPVRSSVTKNRIKWVQADKTGRPGILRFMGWGRYSGSGAIRPRWMDLQYSKLERQRSAGGRFSTGATGSWAKRSRQVERVSYGVGGAVPRRTVIGGFVVSRDGRVWQQSYQSGFKAAKALVFRRKGKARLPIELASPVPGAKGPRDVAVGELASAVGLPQRMGDVLQQKAMKEFTGRVEREIAAKAAGARR